MTRADARALGPTALVRALLDARDEVHTMGPRGPETRAEIRARHDMLLEEVERRLKLHWEWTGAPEYGDAIYCGDREGP